MSGLSLTGDELHAGLFSPLRKQADAEFDITAMIDLVFMMNIYFLVTFVTVVTRPAASKRPAPLAMKLRRRTWLSSIRAPLTRPSGDAAVEGSVSGCSRTLTGTRCR